MATYQRRSPADWQLLFDEFKSAGLSAKSFCTEKGIGLASFYQWRKRLSGNQATTAAPTFVDLSSFAPAVTQSAWHIELDLGDGLTLRLNRG